jgi:hypothetical protein
MHRSSKYNGSTALIIAAWFDFDEVVVKLLRAGAVETICDDQGRTAPTIWKAESGSGKEGEWERMVATARGSTTEE